MAGEGVTYLGGDKGAGTPPPTDEQLVAAVVQAVTDAKIRDIDLVKVLTDAGVPVLTNPNEPVVNIQRRGFRLVGNAYDVSRVLEATKRAMEYFEQAGASLNEAMTIVVHAPQDDEP